MIKNKQTTQVQAEVSRVWNALVVPAELEKWNPVLNIFLSDPKAYPEMGKSYWWRHRFGPFKFKVLDQPLVVAPLQEFTAKGYVAVFDWWERILLREVGQATEVEFEMGLRCRIPLIGDLIDALLVKGIVKEALTDELKNLHKYCEGPK